MHFLAAATAGSYDDPLDSTHPDLIEMFYGVEGQPRAHRAGNTGAGHSDDEEGSDEDIEMDDEDQSLSDADSSEQSDDTGSEGSQEEILDPESSWTDVSEEQYASDEDEDSDEEENMVYTIMNQQTPNVRHAAIKVPRVQNPFVSAARLDDFLRALEDLEHHNILPEGLLARPQEWMEEWEGAGYPTWESLAVGRSRKNMAIDLPCSIWVPRAQRWCQAVDMLTRFQRDGTGMISA